MATCATCVPRLYKGIIEEVISSVRENFLDEGIDEQVLVDLKQQWEAKLAATKATEQNETPPTTQSSTIPSSGSSSQSQQSSQSQNTAAVQNMALVPVQITVPSQQAGGVSKTITIHVPSTALSSGIAGPQLQNILSAPAAAQTFALEAPRAAEIIQRQLNTALEQHGVVLPPQLLQFNQGSSQVDGPVDSALGEGSVQGLVSTATKATLTDGTGPSVRPRVKKVKKLKTKRERDNLVAMKGALKSNRDVLIRGSSSKSSSVAGVLKEDKAFPDDSNVKVLVETPILDEIVEKRLQAGQVDGACGLDDSSDEISDDDDDDDEEEEKEDDKKELEEDENEDEDAEEWNDDPLNSDDDVSDNDAQGDIFETDNVVVCQYDKITRVRNKWKFHLKDGIMSLKTKDYIFTKANGEGEW